MDHYSNCNFIPSAGPNSFRGGHLTMAIMASPRKGGQSDKAVKILNFGSCQSRLIKGTPLNVLKIWYEFNGRCCCMSWIFFCLVVWTSGLICLWILIWSESDYWEKTPSKDKKQILRTVVGAVTLQVNIPWHFICSGIKVRSDTGHAGRGLVEAWNSLSNTSFQFRRRNA